MFDVNCRFVISSLNSTVEFLTGRIDDDDDDDEMSLQG